ncbi:hypothetical protein [Arthrobacter sp. ISL-5]|uniref:hypothetical protein n=1 Tax=Arthrobacter sp. ISL-5 TaxID=2819111 RepID=UPI001BE6150B|nr:hypothetical protein [Arthrobacter sp. ISL-5]MBT2552416.1 hypothetical protein [Arthrobacter sp. ISL-5]
MVSFELLGVLYFVVTAVIAVLAVYALVLVVVFLRLWIRELKATQHPGGDK